MSLDFWPHLVHNGIMAKRLDKTLADYVVGGLMPALLMGLLCSLCYFLLELAYSGAFMGQMKWILFFFIVGTVLIARISMRGDISDRAGLYGIGLAIAAGLAMIRFVDIPKSALGGFGWLIPFSLMSIIWWSAHKLTQDSTWDDDDEEDGGGLLDAAEADAGTEESRPSKSAHWFDSYQADRTEEQQKKKPGLMVVYFSLAALPLFGIGQAMIPATNIEGRRYAFWMLTIYVGCGLGMLLTTSFLGLRRYLRGRRLHMPASMTAMWLGIGTAMILALMVLSAILLPRPEAEYPLSQLLGWATSKDRDANDTHFFEASGGKSNKQGSGPQSKQNAANNKQQNKNESESTPNRKGNQAGQPDMKGKTGQQQGQSSKQGQSDKNSGAGNTKQGETGKSNQKGDSQSGKQSGGNSQKNQQKGGNQKNEEGSNSGNQEKQDQRNPNGKNRQQEQEQQNEQAQREQEQQQQNEPPPEEQQSSASWAWLKWLGYALLIAGVLFALWKWGKQLLEGIKQIWRDILAWFRSWIPQRKEDNDLMEIPNPESELPPRPFAWFSNPLNNPGNFRSMEDMIRYSFAALHSWAHEQHMGRQRDETPTEFAQRLGHSVKHAHQDIRKLADLYAVVTYARAHAPSSSETVLRNFWQRVGA